MRNKLIRSQKTYNEMAANYDSSREGIYTNAHRAKLQRSVPLKDGDCVLDVACGNGALLAALSAKAKINAYGIDIAENMIARARERCPDGIFAIGSSSPLGFEDESMDIITVSCAFHHFETPRKFADECKRVLKPGGVIYLAEPYFPAFVRFIANTIVFPFARSGDVKVYSAKQLSAIFRESGFRAIRAEINGTVLFFSAEK